MYHAVPFPAIPERVATMPELDLAWDRHIMERVGEKIRHTDPFVYINIDDMLGKIDACLIHGNYELNSIEIREMLKLHKFCSMAKAGGAKQMTFHHS